MLTRSRQHVTLRHPWLNQDIAPHRNRSERPRTIDVLCPGTGRARCAPEGVGDGISAAWDDLQTLRRERRRRDSNPRWGVAPYSLSRSRTRPKPAPTDHTTTHNPPETSFTRANCAPVRSPGVRAGSPQPPRTVRLLSQFVKGRKTVAGAPAAAGILDQNTTLQQLADVTECRIRRALGDLGVFRGRQFALKVT